MVTILSQINIKLYAFYLNNKTYVQRLKVIKSMLHL